MENEVINVWTIKNNNQLYPELPCVGVMKGGKICIFDRTDSVSYTLVPNKRCKAKVLKEMDKVNFVEFIEYLPEPTGQPNLATREAIVEKTSESRTGPNALKTRLITKKQVVGNWVIESLLTSEDGLDRDELSEELISALGQNIDGQLSLVLKILNQCGIVSLEMKGPFISHVRLAPKIRLEETKIVDDDYDEQ